MIYIQLSSPYRDYNRVRISSVHFFDKEDRTLNFKYEVYKQQDVTQIKLFENAISINDQTLLDTISDVQSSGTQSAYDTICKELLDYLIQSNIETGTLEWEV